ncbi:MAG: HlyD family secretion protein [Pseudomonadota bacterium]
MSVLSCLSAVGPGRAAVPAVGARFFAPGLSRKTLKAAAVAVAAAAAAGVGAYAGYDYWMVGRFLQSTDDAYVRADYTTITPRVSGSITQVMVRDNEPVVPGQLLARIDDRDFRVAFDAAKAEAASAEAALRYLDARIAQQQAMIDREKADIASGKAALSMAEADRSRYENLKNSGYGSIQRAEQAAAAWRERMAQLRKSRAGLLGAQRSVDVLVAERARMEAERDRSLAALRQAALNMDYTSIVAPIAGTVGARSLRVGQYVEAGTPLMAVVPLQSVYVVANYRETQLAGMRPGQPVSLEVDAFPGVTLRGRVDSLAPASGMQFALLPADNATGNFTKIVQRVPVRIVIDDHALAGRLRPGMSVRPVVDTRSGWQGTGPT